MLGFSFFFCIMKTKFISILSLVALSATQSFATITSDAEFSANVYTTKVSGVESASNLTESKYSSLWLENATLNIENTTLTVSSKTATLSGYVLLASENTTINVGTNGKLVVSGAVNSIKATNNSSSSNKFVINVSEDSLGVNTSKIYMETFNNEFNLNKEYAFSNKNILLGVSSNRWNVKTLTITTAHNQAFALDSRHNTTYNLNISNKAVIDITDYACYTYNIGEVVYDGNVRFKIADGLVDGAILFHTDGSYENTYEWDEEKAALRVTDYSGKVQNASFIDANGNALTNLSFTAVDGGYLLTGMVAVPEPAEWAMILGALALGFAIYRKRK